MNKRFISAVMTVWFCCTLSASAYFLRKKWDENQKMRSSLVEVEKNLVESNSKIADMKKRINDLKTSPKEVNRIAREKFFMCRKGERIYRFMDEEKHPYKNGDQ